jgi:hypothetical protein
MTGGMSENPNRNFSVSIGDGLDSLESQRTQSLER